MPFRYVATTKRGEMRRGLSDLGSRDAVIQDLESKRLIVISVEEVRSLDRAKATGAKFFGLVSHLDIVLFTKHLAVMLKAGLSLLDALRSLEEQAANWHFRSILRGVSKSVETGNAFSDALAAYPRVFSPFYVNIIRAGEVSGNLEQSLGHLATKYAKDHEMRGRVRSALLYPVIVVLAALFIGFFFAVYVIPQVANLFAGLKGVELPTVTVILIKVARFTRKYTLASFLAMVGGIAFIFWFLRRRFLSPVTHLVAMNLPVIGKIVREVNLARFALIMSTLLKSGVPITKALDVTADVLDNFYFKRAIRSSLTSIQRGAPLSESMAEYGRVFPKITSRMVAVGERSGKLEDVLGYLSDFYDLEVEMAVRNLTSALEPLLLVVIGLITLAMAFAIIMPIYNFIGMISRI